MSLLVCFPVIDHQKHTKLHKQQSVSCTVPVTRGYMEEQIKPLLSRGLHSTRQTGQITVPDYFTQW